MEKQPGEERWVDVDNIPAIVNSAKNAFRSGKTKNLEWRRTQLQSLKKLLTNELKGIVAALEKDLKQTEFLARLAEVDGIVFDIDLTLENLDKWASPQYKSVPLAAQPATGYIQQEPYGTVLLIAPWNYPIRLTLMPLVGIIAAGNCCVIKPSEVSNHCSEFLATVLPKYLDNECIKVIEGGIAQSTALLKTQFDYIFYTGNTQVGKIVMKAAAEHLTPVTLELGGKSPVIINEDCDLDVSARRIIWGKFSNAGQTCVAPDYILCHSKVQPQIIDKLKQYIKQFYGEQPKQSKDYTRIINVRHTNRLKSLLDGENIAFGGDVDVNERYIAPTLVVNPNINGKLMEDEIFGPILPIISVSSIDEAITFVNKKPKPLALYVFTGDKKVAEKISDNTSSGSVCINDSVMQVACQELPFGGVGPSGCGRYNGKYTFDTFSHEKTVMSRPTWADPSIRYPPYTPSKIFWILKLSAPLKIPKALIVGVFAIAIAGAITFYYKGYSKL